LVLKNGLGLFWLSSGSEEDVIMEDWSQNYNTVGFGDGEKEPGNKESGQFLEPREGKKRDSLLECPERNAVLWTPSF
jgi:hypothetical protein